MLSYTYLHISVYVKNWNPWKLADLFPKQDGVTWKIYLKDIADFFAGTETGIIFMWLFHNGKPRNMFMWLENSFK